MSAEQARRAMRELGRLEAMTYSTVRACAAAGLDVGPLGSMASGVKAYSTRAREILDWPPPMHPRCGQRHGPSEPCPAPEGA